MEIIETQESKNTPKINEDGLDVLTDASMMQPFGVRLK